MKRLRKWRGSQGRKGIEDENESRTGEGEKEKEEKRELDRNGGGWCEGPDQTKEKSKTQHRKWKITERRGKKPQIWDRS